MALVSGLSEEPLRDSKQSEPIYDDAGVDLTLVRYSLSLTPTERLRSLENYMNAIASVRPVRIR